MTTAAERTSPFDAVLGTSRGDRTGPAPAGQLPVTRTLELSTGHLSAADAAALTLAAEGTGEDRLPRVIAHTYGWMLPVRSAQDDADAQLATEYPSLNTCLAFARFHGCQWLYFDADAELIEQLDNHEW